MSEHTKGRWYFFSNSIGVGVTVAGKSDVAWTRCERAGLVDSIRSREEDEANARLIATAPAMLRELQILADYAERNGARPTEARAIIAAAKGAGA